MLLARALRLGVWMKKGTTRAGPGRPRGRTTQGDETREHIYRTALSMISERGFEATTLRDVAEQAGVSPGLLYRYFDNKRAVVLALYDELSKECARRAALVEADSWRKRFLFALETNLSVLAPHRAALSALIPVLFGDSAGGIFADASAPSRLRVQQIFLDAVQGASDAPPLPTAEALGRVLYVAHLAFLLWWLLDRSPEQRATYRMLQSLHQAEPFAELLIGLPFVEGFLLEADSLCREALLKG